MTAPAPITMQDVRLVAGEGKLEAWAVLEACNVINRQRHERCEVRSGDVMAPTQEYVLRAMAVNYAGGHSWDHLDGEACSKAADEIAALRAGDGYRAAWLEMIERCNVLKEENYQLRHPAQAATDRQLYELSDEDYEAFTKALGAGKPPTQKLIDLMRDYSKTQISTEAREKEITRLATIETCARELETSYPDHAWLNAACAAIRGLSAPSAKALVMQAAENAAKIVDSWSNSKKEYADQITRGSELPSASRGTES